MNKFDLVDPTLKLFCQNFFLKLTLGQKEYDLRIVEFGEKKGSVRVYEPDEKGIVKIGIMPADQDGSYAYVPLESLYAVLEKIKGDL